ncbi:MAG: 4-(cytidine 5'-diphospho)-2-C-methyl-D-erythritol kinase [Sediminibacterium sp.]|nr:4-(cytidine 5'-diphospho)-2-C-methyl-D-erythritol kinase [Sediminibacterium sp.]
MISYPNCKINLGLQIHDKRADGFHNIETIFLPITIYDIIEFIPQKKKDINNVTCSVTGINIDSTIENNLCVKAYNLLKKTNPTLPPIQLHIHKIIPIGAGLGGGSADAACMLKELNNFFELKLSNVQLQSLALELGSDCPFFIENKPVFATGRGEVFTEIKLDLSNYAIIILFPNIAISTKWAFDNVQIKKPTSSLLEEIKKPMELWKHTIYNDFEESIFKEYPILQALKNQFYESNAVYASLSGTGSVVYGIFKKTDPLFYLQNMDGLTIEQFYCTFI